MLTRPYGHDHITTHAFAAAALPLPHHQMRPLSPTSLPPVRANTEFYSSRPGTKLHKLSQGGPGLPLAQATVASGGTKILRPNGPATQRPTHDRSRLISDEHNNQRPTTDQPLHFDTEMPAGGEMDVYQDAPSVLPLCVWSYLSSGYVELRPWHPLAGILQEPKQTLRDAVREDQRSHRSPRRWRSSR